MFFIAGPLYFCSYIIRKSHLYFGYPQNISVRHGCHARKVNSFRCQGKFNRSLIKFHSFKEVRQRCHIHRNKAFVPLAEEGCFKKLNDMQADIYIGFPIRSIHPALSFTFTINASFDSSQSGKLKIYGSGTVSTSSCMFRMVTNGETDHLQHDLPICGHNFSYKFTSCIGICFLCMYKNNYEHLPMW